MTVGRLLIADDGARADLRWDEAPDLTFVLTVRRDGTVAELTIKAPPDGTVGTRSLRSVPVGLMQRAIRSEMERQARDANASADRLAEVIPAGRPDLRQVITGQRGWAAAVRELVDDFGDRPRPGAAGRSDRHYAAIAAMYVDLLDQPRPVLAVAERSGLSEKSVRNLLFKARERGLLTSIGRGRAGGELTDAAKDLLLEGEVD